MDNGRSIFTSSVNLFRQRSIFPGSCPPSIFDAKELNYCVRNGNRWDLLAMTTGLVGKVPSKLNKRYQVNR